MSLVGIDVSLGDESEEDVSLMASAPSDGKASHVDRKIVGKSNVSFDEHPPVSPHSGAEALFLMGLDSQRISATALAEQIRMNENSPPGAGGFGSIFGSTGTYATDDYVSACDDPNISLDEDLQKDNVSNILQKDVLSQLEDPILDDDKKQKLLDLVDGDVDPSVADSKITQLLKEELRGKGKKEIKDLLSEETTNTTTTATTVTTRTTIENEDKVEPEESRMSTDTETPTTTTTPEVAPTEDGVDAVSHVYEGAKNIWGWGKGINVVKPFLGLAEGVANGVVGVVGTNLDEIDGNVTPQLKTLDEKFLNPAVDAVVGVVLGAVQKTESIIKPVLFTILKPLDFLIKNEPENTSTSEATSTTDAPATDKTAEMESVAPEVTHVAAVN